MKVEIREGEPDGLLLSVIDIYVNSFEDAFKIIKAMEKAGE